MLGVSLDEGILCSIFGGGREDYKHLFFHCSQVYKIWFKVTSMWGLHYVVASEVDANFEICFHTSVLGQKSVVWRMAFLVVV